VLKTLKLISKTCFTLAINNKAFRYDAPSALKRSLYAVYLVFVISCQPVDQASTDASIKNNATQSDYLSLSAPRPPLLTLGELFSADDVQIGIKQAVLDKDSRALLFWQEQLVNAGKEVRLSQRDLNLISGEQGLVFIEFEAKKQLFNDEFLERFINFEKIDDVVEKYPYLNSVHEKAYRLIFERDKAIKRAVIILLEDGFTGDAEQEAKDRWMQFMQDSGNLN
jgi:hypothetical protein